MNINIYRSDIQELIRGINRKRTTDREEALRDCDKIEAYGIERKEDALIGFARFTRGEIYYAANDIPNFYRDMMECMKPYEHIREWGYLVMANIMLGIMSLNRGNQPMALDYYDRAEDYCTQYSLPDLAWMVHMNKGSLYLILDEFGLAAEHFTQGLHYIEGHSRMPARQEHLSAAYVGLGKCALREDRIDDADKYARLIRMVCLPDLSVENSVPLYFFFARLFHAKGNDDGVRDCFARIRAGFTEKLPMMDIFDDLYQYLKLLLDMEEYEEFLFILDKASSIAEQTKVRNFSRKLLTLRLRYEKKVNDNESFRRDTAAYFDLAESLQQENRFMTKQMIDMRHEMSDLVEEKREIEKINETLTVRSETDPLTGMYNRLRLNAYGEIAYDRAYRNQTGLAVEILDIDFFKEYNDNYGHQEGDKCIRFIADEILKLKRYGGVFASRYGGDEFVLIYEGYTDKEVFAIAQDLKSSIAAKKFEHRYSRTDTKYVTISQGIFWGIPQAGHNVWNYLHAADRMLYKVKRKSRNSIMVGHAKNGEEQTAFEQGAAEAPIIETEQKESFAPSERFMGNPEDRLD